MIFIDTDGSTCEGGVRDIPHRINGNSIFLENSQKKKNSSNNYFSKSNTYFIHIATTSPSVFNKTILIPPSPYVVLLYPFQV